ncbi:MAG TPA: selenocysteine-specific translation elongation factor [Longimicrobiales bacterium]
MRRVVLGTAGHIDHGKTTLVKALTGTDTDRLPEEKARGITIDLGFAHLRLGDLDVGIVDVPGHEGLIRNMLAGATGFDAMLLVIAADEGVMPQTREHLAIARLLGVERVVVALTKCDTVDAEWLELVQEDVRVFMAQSYPHAPLTAVSAVTGAGIPELSEALARELDASAVRRDADLFRMPIDRVFTVRGTGTVVTGTVWSGRAATQQRASILPGHAVRIRGVQTHGSAVDEAGAGERAAFALSGVERSDVTRGDVLVTADVWRPSQALTARLERLPGVELKQRQRVRVHLGTAETMARVLLLDGEWVQLRLEGTLLARVRDRFVLRSYSPVRTIGGGQVVEVWRVRRRLSATEKTALAMLLDGAVRDRIAAAIALADADGARALEVPITAGVTPDEVADFATSLPPDVLQIGDAFYPAAVLESAIAGLAARVAAFHAQHPLESGVDRAQLVAGLRAGHELAEAALRSAEQRGLLVSSGSTVAAAGFTPVFSGKQQVLRDQVVERLRNGGLMPPTLNELSTGSGNAEIRAVLRRLEAQGEVVGITPDLYLHAAALDDAIRAVRTQGSGRPLSAAEFKTALPVSRKYLIPILEYLDRSGITRREGDVRRIC